MMTAQTNKEWYKIKEKSAGKTRLILSWYLYKIFGKNALYTIAFFVSFFTFVFSGELRKYSKNNLRVMYDFSNKKTPKPDILNSYKTVLNYALSLADKAVISSGNFKSKNLYFEDIKEKEKLLEDIKNKKGIFLICCHIGNIDVLRSFVTDPPEGFKSPFVNVFMSIEQCKIFNTFLDTINKKADIKIFPVEETGIEDAIMIADKLENGEIAVIAGDRISGKNIKANIKTKLMNKEVKISSGAFRFAQMTSASIYFVAPVKMKDGRYKIYLKRFIRLESLNKKEEVNFMIDEYKKFFEKTAQIAPLQFYHFYDFFNLL